MRYKPAFLDQNNKVTRPITVETENSISIVDGASTKGIGDYLTEVSTLSTAVQVEDLNDRVTEIESILDVIPITGNAFSLILPNVLVISEDTVFNKPAVPNYVIEIYARFLTNATISFPSDPLHVGDNGEKVYIKIINFGTERIIQTTSLV